MNERESSVTKQESGVLFRDKEKQTEHVCKSYTSQLKNECIDDLMDYILVCKKADGYVIESHSEGVCSLVKSKHLIGGDIFDVMSETMAPEVLQMSLDTTIVRDDLSTYRVNAVVNDIESAVYMVEMPVVDSRSTRVLISFYYVTKSKEKSDYMSVNEIDLERNSKKQSAESEMNEEALKLLTKREREIIILVLEGSTNKYISTKLSISLGTVKKTLYNAYKKLGVSSRIELVKLLFVE